MENGKQLNSLFNWCVSSPAVIPRRGIYGGLDDSRVVCVLRALDPRFGFWVSRLCTLDPFPCDSCELAYRSPGHPRLEGIS